MGKKIDNFMENVIRGKSKLSPKEVVDRFNPAYRGGEIFWRSLSDDVDLADYIAGLFDISKFKQTHAWSGISPYSILYVTYFLEISINKKSPSFMIEAISISDEPDVFIETIAWLGYDLNRIWVDISYKRGEYELLKVIKKLIDAGSYPKCKYRKKILEKYNTLDLKYNISKKEFRDMIEVLYVHHS